MKDGFIYGWIIHIFAGFICLANLCFLDLFATLRDSRKSFVFGFDHFVALALKRLINIKTTFKIYYTLERKAESVYNT